MKSQENLGELIKVCNQLQTIQDLKSESGELSEQLSEKEDQLKSKYRVLSKSVDENLKEVSAKRREPGEIKTLNSKKDTYFITDMEGFIDTYEDKMLDLFDIEESMVGKRFSELLNEEGSAEEILNKITKSGLWTGQLGIKDELYPEEIKATVNILSEDETDDRILFVLHDIFGRSEIQYKRFKEEIVRSLTNSENPMNVIEDLVNKIKDFSGADAVGMRLKEGEDYPYYETKGFSKRFVQLERSLCERDEDEEIIRNAEGNPVLECMCGNVIRGRTDPEQPFFTGNGSFHTDSTTELLSSSSEEDRQSRTRDRCHGEGYESVVLVPIPYKDENIGLLQLNDEERKYFDDELVHYLEDITDRIGNVIGRFIRGEEIIDELSEKTIEDAGIWQGLVETTPVGVMIVNPDGKIEYANKQAEKVMRAPKDQIIGRKYDGPKWKIKDMQGGEFSKERLPFKLAKSTGEEVQDVRFSIERSDNERIYLSVNARPIFGSENNLKHVITTFEDITEDIKYQRKSNLIKDLLTTTININMEIDKLEEPDEFLNMVCNELQVNLDYLDVRTYLKDEDDVLKPVTHTGEHDLKKIEFDFQDLQKAPDCIQKCVNEEEILKLGYDDSVCIDCEYCSYPDEHRTVLFPILNGEKIRGILDIKLSEERFLYDEEKKILSNLVNDISYAILEQKRQQELKESKERYHRLVENLNSGVVIYEVVDDGEDFIFKDINEAAERIDRVEKENIVGKSLYEVFPNVDEFGLDEVLKKVYKSGESENHPVKKYKDEDRKGWRENYVFKLPSEEVAAVYDDVSEREKTKRELEKSKNRFESLFYNSPVALREEDHSEVKKKLDQLREKGVDDIEKYLDENEDFVKECIKAVKVLDVNDKTLEMYGAENKQEILNNLKNIISKKSEENFKRVLVKISNGETFLKKEDINYTLDGEKINLLVTWRVVPRYEDDYSKVLVSYINISETKEAQERYEDLYKNMNEGMALHEIIYDEDGKAVDYEIKDVNPGFESILDQDRKNTVGKKASELYDTDSSPYLERYEKVVETGESEVFETYFEPLEKHFQISAFKTSKDRFATVFQDITERKKVLEEIKETKNKYIEIFEKFGVPSAIIDDELNISIANEGFCDLLSDTKERIEGNKITKYFEEAEKDKIREYHRSRNIDGNSEYDNLRSTIKDKYNNRKDILLSFSGLKNTDEYIISFFDVAEKERLTEQIRTLEDRLENLESEEVFERFKGLISEETLSEDIKNICLEELVLLVIAYNGETSGKQLMELLEENINLELSSGSMYPLLHKLEDRGLLEKHEYVKSKKYEINEDSEALEFIKKKMHNILNILLMMKFIYDNLEEAQT